ncbi:unnamed protein product [Heligmosomoides polygyrus]|uniref:ATPase_AAA_core domain-containing protein n=1 Tax=Heligmosomoides polygyrus TaxID=6339 RepID=A0A183FPQ0_HELPZ|nr:unnamed protein product [Heligmosomoides polygyrus]
MSKPDHVQCYDAHTPLENVKRCLQDGHHVMILMRGVPGSGKSHLAKWVLLLLSKPELFCRVLCPSKMNKVPTGRPRVMEGVAVLDKNLERVRRSGVLSRAV